MKSCRLALFTTSFSLPLALATALAVDCPPLTLEIEASIETLRQTTEKLRPTRLAHRAYISPEEIRTLDTRLLAELLVKRQHEECDVPRGSDPKSDGIDSQSEIVMMVNSRNLSSIAKYGFQNQHVTATSNGAKNVERRMTAEQNMVKMALSASSKGKELLPKYAAFNIKRSDFGTFELPTGYGDVAVIFKPSVRKRTTWTYQDSLTLALDPKDEFLPRTTRAQKLSTDTQMCFIYCEAQIWGDLDLSDVDSILVLPKDNRSNGYSTPSSNIPKEILKSGIPIYELKSPYGVNEGKSQENQALQYERGKLIHQRPRPKVITPEKLTSTELTDRLSSLDIPAAVRRIFEVQLSSFREPGALIAAVKTTPISRIPETIGELAIRRKTPEIFTFLKDSLKDEKLPHLARAQALYGLSELPWKELRPLVLNILKNETNAQFRFMAVALAGDHLDGDDELKSAMTARAATRYTDSSDILLASALLNNKMCGKDSAKLDAAASSSGFGMGGGMGGYPAPPLPSPVR